jgi:RNA 3'-terminal phosphate cyclase (ATP)
MIKSAKRDLADWPEGAFRFHQVDADEGPGIILMLEARSENVTEIVSAFGQLGVTAERLAKTSTARLQGYINSSALAGPYLARIAGRW